MVAVAISRTGSVLMTRADPLEEPCAGQLACTVLQTSGGSDPFAEFNRRLRHAVLWRKSSYGTQSYQGSRFVEAILTVVTTCQQQGRNILAYLTACCRALATQTRVPPLVPQTIS
jgi:hypothetical protein